MKTELRIKPHTVLSTHNVIEIWYANQFIGTVTGADGPGVRVISKYDMSPSHTVAEVGPAVMEVSIKCEA